MHINWTLKTSTWLEQNIQIKTTANHNLLLSLRYLYSNYTELSFPESRLLPIKLRKRQTKNQMQKKEIVHAYSVANTKIGIFLTKKSVYVTLKELHHGSCLIVTGLSPSRLRFNPKPVHMGFVVDKAASGTDWEVLSPPPNYSGFNIFIIPSITYQSLILHNLCNWQNCYITHLQKQLKWC